MCERHREFVPLIAAIERVEGELEEVSPIVLRAETGSLHETLAHELIPHAVGEGRTVFPVLRRVTGTDEITSQMLHEHREISRLTDELDRIRGELANAGLGAPQEAQMRTVLEDLRTAVQQHFEVEEQACFKVLKTELAPEEAEELYAAMERATKEIRRTYGCGGGRDYE
jgi:iron-sulfur cluster repair protein YtfE (RIC family)